MANVNILVIVDTQATMAGNLTVYLVDDDPTEDSGQGSLNLVTHLYANSWISWKPVAINNDDTIELTVFEQKNQDEFFAVSPAPEPNDPEQSWKGKVGDLTPDSSITYGFHFSINGQGKYYFDPELKIRVGT